MLRRDYIRLLPPNHQQVWRDSFHLVLLVHGLGFQISNCCSGNIGFRPAVQVTAKHGSRLVRKGLHRKSHLDCNLFEFCRSVALTVAPEPYSP